MFLSSKLKIFFIRLMPSSSRHLILMFCFSSSFFFFFSNIFFIASSFSFGMYFIINDLFILADFTNSARFRKSFSIFSFIASSLVFSICLNAVSIAWDCLKVCITSFFSFEVTRLRERWMLFPAFRILQTTCLLGTTYCRMSLIRPGAISEETIVPSCPFGSSTNVIVFVTFFTLQRTRSFSFICKKPLSRWFW